MTRYDRHEDQQSYAFFAGLLIAGISLYTVPVTVTVTVTVSVAGLSLDTVTVNCQLSTETVDLVDLDRSQIYFVGLAVRAASSLRSLSLPFRGLFVLTLVTFVACLVGE